MRASPFEARNAEMERMYVAGETLQAVGDCFGLTRARVQQILAARGVQMRSTAEIRSALGKANRARVAKLAAAGATSRAEIARVTGLAYRTVGLIVKDLGLDVPGKRSGRPRHRLERAIRMFDAGSSVAKIAVDCGYKTRASAVAALHKQGRTVRSRKETASNARAAA